MTTVITEIANAIATGVRKHRTMDAQMRVDIVDTGNNWDALAQQHLNRRAEEFDRVQLALSILYSVFNEMAGDFVEEVTVTQTDKFLRDCGFSDNFIDHIYSGNLEDDPWSVY
jgi:hypothetical protein